MTILRSWSQGLSVALCLTLTAAVLAQEEKDPAALWADFSNSIRQNQPEVARQAATALLNDRHLDDRRFADLVNADSGHDALFLTGIEIDKTRGPTERVLERYISYQARPKIAQYWVDFNFYVRTARPDAAQAAASALLDQLEPTIVALLPDSLTQAGGSELLSRLEGQTLLDVVESSDYRDVDQTLQRAARSPSLKDIADKIAQRIQDAQIQRSHDRERIEAGIQRLGEGERANVNAVALLRSAGQYAAPDLLSALLDENRVNLQPYVLAAMVSVGRPIVYPLSVALPDLEPLPQTQVAQVLAEIGYPRALPYLKLVIDNPKTDPNTRQIVEAAYKQLTRSLALPSNVSSAELFLTLGENYYTSGSNGDLTVGLDPEAGMGVVWNYDRSAGLIDTRVPAAIFPDVLAMRAARQSLAINPHLDAALSLWLMSNLRRANRLPAGQVDPSYPTGLQSPSYYLEMAGPLRQHDVLHRALADHDSALALNAIAALSQTAGTDALVNRSGTAQPLLEALGYPDRRVRFAAAFALTNARPQSEFPGSFHVVPVLAEAVRQSDIRYAVILGKDQASANRLASAVASLGYKPITGTKLLDVDDEVNAGPGVDLIVTDLGADQVMNVYHESSQNYKLDAIPIVALVSPAAQIELARSFDRNVRVRPTAATYDPDQLRPALESAANSYAGASISPQEAEKYALTALQLLQQIAISSSAVFHTSDAQPALIQSLGDKRPAVVLAAGSVLALMESPEAQRALANVALDSTRPMDMRIQLLGDLADSATRYGAHLNDVQLQQVLDLTENSPGDLGLAAARVHGALTLPTSDVVQLIEK